MALGIKPVRRVADEANVEVKMRGSDLLPYLLRTGPIPVVDLAMRLYPDLSDCVTILRRLEESGEIDVLEGSEVFNKMTEQIDQSSMLEEGNLEAAQLHMLRGTEVVSKGAEQRQRPPISEEVNSTLWKLLHEADEDVLVGLTNRGFRSASSNSY